MELAVRLGVGLWFWQTGCGACDHSYLNLELPAGGRLEAKLSLSYNYVNRIEVGKDGFSTLGLELFAGWLCWRAGLVSADRLLNLH